MKLILRFALCIVILFDANTVAAQFNQKHYDAAPTEYAKARSKRDKIYCIYKWGERLLKENPDITVTDLRRVRSLSYGAERLFYDNHFVPVFGKPIDEISEQLVKEIRFLKSGKGTAPSILRGEQQFFSFGCSKFRRKGNTTLQSIRKENARWDHINRELNREDISFDEVALLVNQTYGFRNIYWPSEIETLRNRVEQLKLQKAEAGLAEWKAKSDVEIDVNNKLATRQAFESYHRLEISALYKSLPPEVQKRELAWAKQRATAIVDRAATAALSEIDEVAQSSLPVEDLNKWFDDFAYYWIQEMKDYPSLVNVSNHYYEKKRIALEATENRWVKAFQEAETLQELYDIKTAYITHFLPGIPIYDRLKAVYDQRHLELSPVIADFKYIDVVTLDAPENSRGEPTEDQMILATLKYLSLFNEKPLMQQVLESGYQFTSGEWLGAIVLAADAETNYLKSAIELKSFSKLECLADEKSTGYNCNYKIQYKAVGGVMAELLEVMGLDKIDYQEEEEAFFIYTKDYGWLVVRDETIEQPEELPCCWFGDIRVRWGNCQESGCRY